jgi:hypothetical protein
MDCRVKPGNDTREGGILDPRFRGGERRGAAPPFETTAPHDSPITFSMRRSGTSQIAATRT